MWLNPGFVQISPNILDFVMNSGPTPNEVNDQVTGMFDSFLAVTMRGCVDLFTRINFLMCALQVIHKSLTINNFT